MEITLACTWQPRGELLRFQQLRPQLEHAYARIVIVTPSDADPAAVHPLREQTDITIVDSPHQGWGRYLALQAALMTSPCYIHYADLDRLLHWVETAPNEWWRTIVTMQHIDCLIMGRTTDAFGSHPQAMQQTEHIINAVGSYLLRQRVDFGGGSRGLSQRAAQVVIRNSMPGRWGDVEWPILIQRAGFTVSYRALDGLEWESADRYRASVADVETRQRAAVDYDRHTQSWVRRVHIAQEIVQEGFEAAGRSMTVVGGEQLGSSIGKRVSRTEAF